MYPATTPSSRPTTRPGTISTQKMGLGELPPPPTRSTNRIGSSGRAPSTVAVYLNDLSVVLLQTL
jgi:hypothetical protein